MSLILLIKSPNKENQYVLETNSSVVIGRGTKADCAVEDEKVSSTHCTLTLRPTALEISDLSSKNGTYLNGIRIERAEIFLGDIIKIGDSIINIDESRVSPDLIENLTFPGPSKNRIDYELKADFTGARIQNQQQKKIHLPSHAKEIAVRVKAKTKIKLSKEEIREKYKFLSLLAGGLDAVVLLIILVLPLLNHNLFNSFSAHFGTQKIVFILGLDLIMLLTFWIVNFKIWKFTAGEFLSGLKFLYNKQ